MRGNSLFKEKDSFLSSITPNRNRSKDKQEKIMSNAYQLLEKNESTAEFIEAIHKDKITRFAGRPIRTVKDSERSAERLQVIKKYQLKFADHLKEKNSYSALDKAAFEALEDLKWFSSMHSWENDNFVEAWNNSYNQPAIEKLNNAGINTDYLRDYTLEEMGNISLGYRDRKDAFVEAFCLEAKNHGSQLDRQEVFKEASRQVISEHLKEYSEKMPEYKKVFDNPDNHSEEEIVFALSNAIALTDKATREYDDGGRLEKPSKKDILDAYTLVKDDLEDINDYVKYPVEGAGYDSADNYAPYLINLAREYNLSANQIKSIYKKILL